MHFINKKMVIFQDLFNSILKSIFIKNYGKGRKSWRKVVCMCMHVVCTVVHSCKCVEYPGLCFYWNPRKMYIYFINKNDIVSIILCLFVSK